jgi:hypothetical protein
VLLRHIRVLAGAQIADVLGQLLQEFREVVEKDEAVEVAGRADLPHLGFPVRKDFLSVLAKEVR